jgi:hypothetical protein
MPEQYSITLPENGPTKAEWVQIICDAENYEQGKIYIMKDFNGDPVLDIDGNATYGEHTKPQYALTILHKHNMNYLRKLHLKAQEIAALKVANVASTFDLDGMAV